MMVVAPAKHSKALQQIGNPTKHPLRQLLHGWLSLYQRQSLPHTNNGEIIPLAIAFKDDRLLPLSQNNGEITPLAIAFKDGRLLLLSQNNGEITPLAIAFKDGRLLPLSQNNGEKEEIAIKAFLRVARGYR